jgi:hypothetical protein
MGDMWVGKEDDMGWQLTSTARSRPSKHRVWELACRKGIEELKEESVRLSLESSKQTDVAKLDEVSSRELIFR